MVMIIFGQKRATSPDPLGEDGQLSLEVEAAFRQFLEPYAKTKEERDCLRRLLIHCVRNGIHVSYHLLFRFACCNSFEYAPAKKALLSNYDHPYMSIRMDQRIAAFLQETQMFYPLHGLKSKVGNSQVLYFQSSKYVPKRETNQACLDSFSYTLQCMNENEAECRNGITIINYLKGYGLKNHDTELGDAMVRIMTGSIIPLKVNTVLLVDAPKIFSQALKLSKTFMTQSLRKKLKIVKTKDLGDYLMPGYQEHLPNEMAIGWRDGAEVVEDFVDQKRFEESMPFGGGGLSTRSLKM